MSKRYHIARSSSQGGIGVFRLFESPRALFEKNHPNPVRNPKPVAPEPPKEPRPVSSAVKKKAASRSIFTVGSPEREKSNNEGKSNKIEKPAEGYLGAFCNPGCPQDQMDLDGFEEEIAKDIEMGLGAAGTFNNHIPKSVSPLTSLIDFTVNWVQ